MNRLLTTIERLLAPDGCAWDRQQDKASIAKYLLEEVYELLDAIANGDASGECEELGDVIFLLLFIVQLAKERAEYQIDDVLQRAQEKMQRRHPHIFGNTSVSNIEEIKANWRAIKQKEKELSNSSLLNSILGNIPPSLPQLMRAQKAQTRAAEIGFDWDNVEGIFAKLEEEIAELRTALQNGKQAQIEEEIGDVLFSAVNISRFLGFGAEAALSVSTEKFIGRFHQMESAIKENGSKIEDMNTEALNKLWDKIKEQKA